MKRRLDDRSMVDSISPEDELERAVKLILIDAHRDAVVNAHDSMKGKGLPI